MGEYPRFRGPGVVGHHGEGGRYLRPGGQLVQGTGGAGRVVRTCADDERGAVLAADPRAGVHDGVALGRRERGVLPRGPEGDQACRAGVDGLPGQFLQFIGRKVSVVGEWRDEGDVQAPQ